jgi:hypothetical protein
MIPGPRIDDGGSQRVEQWRIFDIRLKYFQAVGKHQAFYTNSLCLMLAVVWTWKLLSGGQGVTIQILGATVSITGFWPAVPFVATVLLRDFSAQSITPFMLGVDLICRFQKWDWHSR